MVWPWISSPGASEHTSHQNDTAGCLQNTDAVITGSSQLSHLEAYFFSMLLMTQMPWSPCFWGWPSTMT